MIRGLIVLVAAAVVAALGLRSVQRGPSVATPSLEDRSAQIKNGNLTHRLRTWAKHFGVFLVVLAAGGFLVAASGIIPIKASSGHWAITEWFLNFSMHRSVATHTLGGRDAPPLDDPALVLKGAGHYEAGCRPCHGSPDFPRPRIAQQMTVHPPYLPPLISEWEPDELFYIVKHGIKFTGMPAWPARHRDDEVWAVVAFLLTLPDLDAMAYRRLVDGKAASPIRNEPVDSMKSETTAMEDLVGPEEIPGIVTESCGRCHGVDGLGRSVGAFPRLAGQHPAYFEAALRAYARGERHSGIMEPIAAGLGEEAMRTLARYYGSLAPAAPASAPPDAAPAVERGREIAQRGIPNQGVPSCMDCHGPGNPRSNPAYPVLAGQYADYLVLQLELFKQGHRGGSAYAHLMREVAPRLTPEQMRDVALFYESLSASVD